MKYLDRRAAAILETVRAALEPQLPEGITISAVEESIYASERGDRGAMFYLDWDDDPRQLALPETERRESCIADVRVEIPAAEGYGDEGGWGFGFGVGSPSGECGPGAIMDNFTPHVWTRDREEIRARLAVLEYEAEAYADDVAEWLSARTGLLLSPEAIEARA